MPLPKKRKGEPTKKFISRCMADPVMNKEYPDRAQRYAICNNQAKSTSEQALESLAKPDDKSK